MFKAEAYLEWKGVSFYGIIDVEKELFGDQHVDYRESSAAVMAWCEEHDAAYYASPHESFSEGEAGRLAIAEGKSAVVVEDLS